MTRSVAPVVAFRNSPARGLLISISFIISLKGLSEKEKEASRTVLR
jgi:hypothetical protein